MLRAEGSTQAERRTDTMSSRPLLRFGSALQVPPHFHSRVPDGVFVPGEGGVRFEALPPPTQATEVGVRLPPRKQPRCAFLEGFCLHANTHLHENAKQAVERLCRYGARGALALERLSRAEDGRIAYRMKCPLPDGTTHLLFTGLALLRRLASLVPQCVHFCSLKQGRSRGLRRRAPPLARGWRSRGRSAYAVWTGPGWCAGGSPWKCWRA